MPAQEASMIRRTLLGLALGACAIVPAVVLAQQLVGAQFDVVPSAC
jgi:hypothetical protein